MMRPGTRDPCDRVGRDAPARTVRDPGGAGRDRRRRGRRAGARCADADLTVAALLLLVTVLAVGTLGLAAGTRRRDRRVPVAELVLHRTDRIVQDPPHRRRRRARRVRGVGRARRLDRATALDAAPHRAAARSRGEGAPRPDEPAAHRRRRRRRAAQRGRRARRALRVRGLHAHRRRAARAGRRARARRTCASTGRASRCSPAPPHELDAGRPRAARSARRGARGRRRPAAAAGRGARRAPRRRGRAPARRVPVGGQPQPAHAADRGEGGGGDAAVVVVAHRARGTARAARDDLRRGRTARTARAQHARAEPHPRRRARRRARARRHRRPRATRGAPAPPDRARAPRAPRRRRRSAAGLARRHDGRADPAEPAGERAALRAARLGDPRRRRAAHADGVDEIELRVADHGPGVPARSARPHLRGVPERRHPARSHRAPGSVSRSCAPSSSRTAVRCATRTHPGGGATFVCTFPREARAA